VDAAGGPAEWTRVYHAPGGVVAGAGRDLSESTGSHGGGRSGAFLGAEPTIPTTSWLSCCKLADKRILRPSRELPPQPVEDARTFMRKDANADDKNVNEARAGKKPYQKPEFRYERVFETMALACGKMSPTELQCRFNRKSS
jgi:hypothetical protein